MVEADTLFLRSKKSGFFFVILKKYFFFCSAKWNGITVADLVFPWFMWIMGVSMAISIQSQLRNSMTRKRIAFNIAKRSLILFSLGLIINSIGNVQLYFNDNFVH